MSKLSEFCAFAGKFLSFSAKPQSFLCFFKLFAIGSIIIFDLGCRKNTDFNNFTPQFVLWAWERPENLEFIDTDKFGVAFLAQTLILQNNEVVYNPRRQPLKVPTAAKLIAVTRIETNKRGGNTPDLSDLQLAETAAYILKTVEMKNISAIQIDFDAAVSERAFYRKLLNNLRQNLPKDFPLSITVLASFCMDDNWIRDLPFDEAVPMIFRMGADEKTVKSFLANGGEFHNPRCQTSYGIAADEPVKANFPVSRRVYFFNVHSWTQNDVESLKIPSIN